ncbi:ABC transporter permease [bacterium]|nr:ABC transporter permease [bacterium]
MKGAAILAGLVVGLCAAAVAGENPLHVFGVMLNAGFGTAYDVGMTLVYTTPLIFTGLSVAVAYRAGLFNIGAEGQLVLGAMAATAAALGIGSVFPGLADASSAGPRVIAMLVCALAAATAGGLAGLLVGYLRARRGSHEVVTSIMVNFLVMAFTSWMVLERFHSLDTQNPETRPVGLAFKASSLPLFGGAPVTVWFVCGMVAAVGVWFVFQRTRSGFGMLATGANPVATTFAGIDTGRQMMLAMAIAGALAGLGGLGDVLGGAGRFRIGFSSDYGFTGIAVALLAGGRPGAVVASALLFGALHKGALDLDFETDHVTRDLATIIQGCVILFATAKWFQGRKSS